MALEIRNPAFLRFGTFEVDLRVGELRKQGKRIKLQDQPFQVLAVLLQRPSDVVTREELRSQIWPQDTFVDFDNSLNTAINKLREALGDSADNPRFIETLPRRGYRFLVPVASGNGLDPQAVNSQKRTRWKIVASVLAILIIAVACAGRFYVKRQRERLTDKDTVVVAEFLNNTGDSVFDETLKQGLRAQLGQSPFLNLLSDQEVGEELRLMARQPGERLTPDLARDLCQRIGSKAVLTGSISSLGSHYVISLSAWNCRTGAELASEQSESSDKEHVLATLGASASRIRKELGESLGSIEKFDAPIERVTTSSLEALSAYTLGMKHVIQDDHLGALPYFQRAVAADPEFASAYMRVGYALIHIEGQGAPADENFEKAYALRDRVSRREYFQISTRHFGNLDDLDKAEEEEELWAEAYPRDAEARLLLTDAAMWRGNWDAATKQARLALDANPKDVRSYYNLAVSELALNRPEAAARTTDQALAQNRNDIPIHQARYWIAFVRHDVKEMENELSVMQSLTQGNPDTELSVLGIELATEVYYGKLTRAHDVFQRIASALKRSRDLIGRTVFYTYWAFLNAELGNKSEARAYVQTAAQPHQPTAANFTIALAAARAGEISLAEKSASKYDLISPSRWWQQKRYLPVVRAAIAMARENPAEAIEHLRTVNGDTEWFGNDPGTADGLMPAYLRGMAYLQLRRSKEAAAEFQRLVDHPGIVVNSPFGALALVGLGRAYVLQGDTMRARAAYEDFFRIWKDADPDIPIFQQAKAEYAKFR